MDGKDHQKTATSLLELGIAILKRISYEATLSLLFVQVQSTLNHRKMLVFQSRKANILKHESCRQPARKLTLKNFVFRKEKGIDPQ